ncbi:CDP-diacylglycerol--serine O-phosphatidyltransferase [Rudanella paleaurantiibacter]|nr:CDP-diacylglycerol--serine O-phosphatidyltransferase [Rudanella paleaurantiibacter]
MLKHLPNAMTCGNLLCGCLGIVQVYAGNLPLAAGLIFAAALLDFGDGFVARLVNAQSAIGKELDSLADCVTFGVLPAFIIFSLLGAFAEGAGTLSLRGDYLPYIAFSLAVFSALRLAKFNVDTRQSDSFIGVPTPANALAVAAFPLMIAYGQPGADLVQQPWFLVGYSLVMSYLLVAELPLMAFKFKTFAWADNQIKYIFLVLSALLLLFLQFAGLPLIILLYILFSLIFKK